MDWVLEDTRDRISDSQFGGLAGISAVTALLFMLHKWYQAMETSKRIIRVTFLDFRKAFDLIDHNQLLKNDVDACQEDKLRHARRFPFNFISLIILKSQIYIDYA